MTWRERAACYGTFNPDFFVEKGKSARAARAICQTCPVTRECLDYAMATRQYYGIWSGTTYAQRRKLRLEEAA